MDQLLTYAVNTGLEICSHSPPCHPPIPWLQALAYARLGEHLLEVTVTMRAVKR